jgi:adenylate kinase family enzyme
MARIHIVGASGSGTTSLGLAVAEALGSRHLDTDDFYWMPTDPPFTTPRAVQSRLALLQAQATRNGSWVLSGSALKWGVPVEPLYDLIVFLTIDPRLRMERIRQRESARYGARIEAGGDMATRSWEFLQWAASYDTAGPERRSLAAHEAWLLTQSAPILRLDTSSPVEELVHRVTAHAALGR